MTPTWIGPDLDLAILLLSPDSLNSPFKIGCGETGDCGSLGGSVVVTRHVLQPEIGSACVAAISGDSGSFPRGGVERIRLEGVTRRMRQSINGSRSRIASTLYFRSLSRAMYSRKFSGGVCTQS